MPPRRVSMRCWGGCGVISDDGCQRCRHVQADAIIEKLDRRLRPGTVVASSTGVTRAGRRKPAENRYRHNRPAGAVDSCHNPRAEQKWEGNKMSDNYPNPTPPLEPSQPPQWPSPSAPWPSPPPEPPRRQITANDLYPNPAPPLEPNPPRQQRRGYAAPPRNGTSAGSIAVGIIIAVIVIGWLISKTGESAQITTCNPGQPYCTQTTVPIETQGAP